MRFAIAIPQYARGSRFDDGAFRAHLAGGRISGYSRTVGLGSR